jgi:hypothetical protein
MLLGLAHINMGSMSRPDALVKGGAGGGSGWF